MKQFFEILYSIFFTGMTIIIILGFGIGFAEVVKHFTFDNDSKNDNHLELINTSNQYVDTQEETIYPKSAEILTVNNKGKKYTIITFKTKNSKKLTMTFGHSLEGVKIDE